MYINNIRKNLINSKKINLLDYSNSSDFYGLWVSSKIFFPFLLLIFGLNLSHNIFINIILSFLVGVYAYKFSFIMHDCAHNSLFKSKKLCERLGHFIGLIVATEYNSYRKVHLLHHINLGNKKLDNDYDEYTFKEKFVHLIKPLLFLRVFNFLKKNNRLVERDERNYSNQVKWIIQFAAIQFIIISIISNLGTSIYKIFFYYIALSTVSLFLGRLRTTAEHGRSIKSEDKDKEFTKTHYPNFVDRLFLYDANFNYHLEHHLFPQMSSFHYPKVFKKIKNEIHDDKTLGNGMLATIFNLKN